MVGSSTSGRSLFRREHVLLQSPKSFRTNETTGTPTTTIAYNTHTKYTFPRERRRTSVAKITETDFIKSTSKSKEKNFKFHQYNIKTFRHLDYFQLPFD